MVFNVSLEQLLLGIPHAATRRVFQLEVTLLESSAIKKKRRDLFRDFFGEMIDLSKQLSPRPIRGGTTTPENLLPNSDRNKASAISVFNIQERVMRCDHFTSTSQHLVLILSTYSFLSCAGLNWHRRQ